MLSSRLSEVITTSHWNTLKRSSEKSTVPINFLSSIYGEYSSYQSITEWLGLEGTSRGHQVSPLNDLSTKNLTWSVSLILLLQVTHIEVFYWLKNIHIFFYIKMTFLKLRTDHRDLNGTEFFILQKK